MIPLCLRITRSDIRPYVKWAINPVFADGHLTFLMDLCGYEWVNILMLSPLEGATSLRLCEITGILKSNVMSDG